MVDTHNQQHARLRQVEHRQNGGDNDQRGAWHTGDALARNHEDQQHDDLLFHGERQAVGLRDEQSGKGCIDHRAVKVERIAKRQNEADDTLLHAEIFQLLHDARVGCFAGSGGKTDKHRLAHFPDQAEYVRAEHQESCAD
ncbi:hypothetical protein D9M70_520240 [compost metagenome]